MYEIHYLIILIILKIYSFVSVKFFISSTRPTIRFGRWALSCVGDQYKKVTKKNI